MPNWIQKLFLLKLIPQQPKRIGARELLAKFTSIGYHSSLRSIQRDLGNVAQVIPELANDGNKDAYGWYWKADMPLLQFPTMDPAMALAFQLGEQYLRPQLPAAVLAPLEPYFKAAANVLATADVESYRQWPDKVRFLPKGQALKSPAIDQEIFHRIQDALFDGRQFTASYQAPEREPAENLFNPLGLVYRGNVVYLVATRRDNPEPRHFALHRFRSLELLESSAQVPEGFNLDEHIRAGHFDWALGEDVQLVAYFYRDAATILAETPLSDDQMLTPCEDDKEWFELRATVKDTMQLRRWLLEWGDEVVVQQPSHLVVIIADCACNMSGYYSENNLQL